MPAFVLRRKASLPYGLLLVCQMSNLHIKAAEGRGGVLLWGPSKQQSLLLGTWRCEGEHHRPEAW